MSKTVTIYCLDVSEGMSEKILDPSTNEEVQKLDLAKEYIQRKIAPKVSRQDGWESSTRRELPSTYPSCPLRSSRDERRNMPV